MSVFSLSAEPWCIGVGHLASVTYVQAGIEAAACSIFQEAGVGGCARYGSVACSSVARRQQCEILLSFMGFFGLFYCEIKVLVDKWSLYKLHPGLFYFIFRWVCVLIIGN